jgi:hypothetical protein
MITFMSHASGAFNFIETMDRLFAMPFISDTAAAS